MGYEQMELDVTRCNSDLRQRVKRQRRPGRRVCVPPDSCTESEGCRK